jgi:hypothetical protein
MQAAILMAVMAIFLTFTVAEMSRNDSANITEFFKAGNVASNIFQYQDSVMQYGVAGYESMHLPVSINPGHVEQVKVVDYTADQIAKYNQKNLLPFLNYKSVLFNYTPSVLGESQPMPILYVATSWDSYTDEVVPGYRNITMSEVMGKLGEDLSKRMYQGDSTYWVVPWIFSRKDNDCRILELYSQLPEDSGGNNMLAKLDNIFNLFCTELGSEYVFKKYVYISPVFNGPDS